MRTHTPSYARSGYHTQLAKTSFDEILDLTAGAYFNFQNICTIHNSEFQFQLVKGDND